ADGGGRSGQITGAGAAATASDRAVEGCVGIGGTTDSSQHPARWHQLLYRIAARFQLSLSVRLRAREREVDKPRTGRGETEAREIDHRLDDLLDDDRGAQVADGDDAGLVLTDAQRHRA